MPCNNAPDFSGMDAVGEMIKVTKVACALVRGIIKDGTHIDTWLDASGIDFKEVDLTKKQISEWIKDHIRKDSGPAYGNSKFVHRPDYMK